jgi:hypothetical protein
VINFHDKKNPAQGPLEGKFIFTDGGMHYTNYSKPMMVLREKGVSVEVQRLNRSTIEGVIVANSVSDDDVPEVMRRASVACVCDNLDEVNIILRANFDSKNLYYASIEAGKTMFSALNGTEVKQNTVPSQGTP